MNDRVVRLVLDDTITRVSPDNIIRVLEANQDVTDVKIVDCSATELLEFMIELQKPATDAPVASSVDAIEGANL